MKENKVAIHVELNKAFAVLLEICLRLDLRSYYITLEAGRTFMSGAIDRSDLPEV